MDKIKINLASGSSLEKPLVSAFRSNGAEYVVLDNEINGTMGLPIILVSKLENNKLVKIVDQNVEWNAVKEVLRLIIAGNQVDYITVEPMLAADDMFFSQLTLPVASFDALKNNYKPNDATQAGGPTLEVVGGNPNFNPGDNMVPPAPPVDSVSPGVVNVTPQVETTPVAPEPVNPMPAEPAMPQAQDAPQVEMPNTTPIAPVMPSAPEFAQNVAPVENTMPENAVSTSPVVENAAPNVDPVVPNVEPIPSEPSTNVNSAIDLTVDKEAFLKACENMFDALVAKFKN